MRTGRSLTVFRRLLLWGGVPGPRGGGPGGVYLVLGGCTWSRGGTWSQGGGVPGPGGWSGAYLVPGGTWSWGGVVWGVYLVRGVYLVLRGVYLVLGGAWSGTPPLWTEWMTDRCKNITLAQTSFRPVIKQIYIKSLRNSKIGEFLMLDSCSWDGITQHHA